MSFKDYKSEEGLYNFNFCLLITFKPVICPTYDSYTYGVIDIYII